jgi:hypothetical protein
VSRIIVWGVTLLVLYTSIVTVTITPGGYIIRLDLAEKDTK